MKKAATEWPGLLLDDDMREYAALHSVEPEVEFESFRDHHLAKGNKFADWRAAWRNWVRNAERYKNEKRPTIGFTAPPRLSMQTQQAMRENEEIKVELGCLTPAELQANRLKIRAIIASIKD